jgi:glycosyltransferase involved in cell wall biosynthesis
MTSIIILTHNAPQYVKITLESLKMTQNAEYEVIVLDNASDLETQELLYEYKKKGFIDKLIYENENTFFARGNNLAFNFCSEKSKYVLFLNSDVEIKSPDWLAYMHKIHTKGVTSLGISYTLEGRCHADGYCIMFDKELFGRYKLNEEYQWFYSMSQLQAKLLKNGYDIKVVKDHEHLLHHFGGKSGTAFMNTKNFMLKKNLDDYWFSKCKKETTIIYDKNDIGSDLHSLCIMGGIYKDGWCCPVVNFKILTKSLGVIKIDCWALKMDDKHNTIHIFVNKKRKKKVNACIEHFSFEFSAPKNQIVHVTLRNDYYFIAHPAKDNRSVSYIINDIQAA